MLTSREFADLRQELATILRKDNAQELRTGLRDFAQDLKARVLRLTLNERIILLNNFPRDLLETRNFIRNLFFDDKQGAIDWERSKDLADHILELRSLFDRVPSDRRNSLSQPTETLRADLRSHTREEQLILISNLNPEHRPFLSILFTEDSERARWAQLVEQVNATQSAAAAALSTDGIEAKQRAAEDSKERAEKDQSDLGGGGGGAGTRPLATRAALAVTMLAHSEAAAARAVEIAVVAPVVVAPAAAVPAAAVPAAAAPAVVVITPAAALAAANARAAAAAEAQRQAAIEALRQEAAAAESRRQAATALITAWGS